jgi:magnesium chelatase subunit I
VGLFNILQEGDVQIKGYPIRLKLDVMLVFTANPEDYTARGKIITPLKDRIGSKSARTIRPTRHNAMAITKQEAWTDRVDAVKVEIPSYVREVVEEVAFQARADRKIDKRSGVSQRLPITTLELVVSNAERRRSRTARAWSCRASRTSTRRCRRSPGSSSSSTKASCAAPSRWRAI